MYTDYGYNYRGTAPAGWNDSHLGLGPRSKWADVSFVKPADVVAPASMFAFGDNKSGRFWPYIAPNNLTSRKSIINAENQPSLGTRHSSAGNYVCVDGHVELIKLEKADEESENARRRWNRDNEPHPELW